MQFNFQYSKVKTFDIKQNGIQVIEDENKLEIYNDPFRTIPLFITKDENDKLIIFSNFDDFYKMENVDKTIDEAGFWEIVLFASGLWTRTLYKYVEQMPAASKIVIDKNTNEYKIERYWDFDIKEDKSIDSIEKAAKGLYDKLDSIFSKLDRNQKYIMGISGGMDSCITLAFLSKYIPKENLELFTYGFDERLLEYKYACEVAEALGYNKPKFHKLTKESYENAMNYLPQMSGGQIGINHCHITSFLRENNLQRLFL
jgi:asparagine synthetase B (glutamine-hydrolysing)